jgi:molybdate transport system ATP-binding protein
VDVIYVATVSIGQQLVEVVISSQEAEHLTIGEKVTVSTKAFAPMIV